MGILGVPVSGGVETSLANLGVGWADYADSEFTSGSPFALVANTDTLLPNNGQNGPKTRAPSDLAVPMFVPSYVPISGVTGTFQVGETITGGTSTDTTRS